MDYKHNKAIVTNAKSLRKNMTKEERHLWYDFLRTYHIRFHRQKVLVRYIVDFYCPEAKIVVELDGSQHYEPMRIEKDTNGRFTCSNMISPLSAFRIMRWHTTFPAFVSISICR